jgi:hypothetical protein
VSPRTRTPDEEPSAEARQRRAVAEILGDIKGADPMLAITALGRIMDVVAEAREEGARLARQEFRPERFDRSWWHYADDCPVPPGTAGAGDSPDPHDDIVQAATGGPDFTPAVWPTAAPDPLGEAPRE